MVHVSFIFGGKIQVLLLKINPIQLNLGGDMAMLLPLVNPQDFFNKDKDEEPKKEDKEAKDKEAKAKDKEAKDKEAKDKDKEAKDKDKEHKDVK